MGFFKILTGVGGGGGVLNPEGFIFLYNVQCTYIHVCCIMYTSLIDGCDSNTEQTPFLFLP